ncbi:MAG: tryptophan synthase subunit alpha [Verrucomicrobia bacterium]|jgi:tryptophan synthase alpha chain|nr:tryptophan synthase subunit alpha [Verrucomicrobiota bacterium]MBT7067495.1 tryptophan synthase subunit alpha [Verrucomicrobiota bacterium]MBT7700981.1 tryptophan synthase subunit alpha [Verrucomicrobiota bacterium]
MNRIESTFDKLKAEGRKGLVGYLTAGDPDVATSEARMRTALDHGVDILEVGVPFSDPTADGPTIQAASFRALQSGMDLPQTLALIARLRADYAEVPIVIFGYLNPFFAYGYERFCRDAAAAGADALLVVDLPYEESEELRQHMRPVGLEFIPLIAPTTPPQRAATLLADAGGFVYYIMVTGVTGTSAAEAGDVQTHVERLRRATSLPIAVGFGVDSGAQARAVGEAAEAVVVGSALINAAREDRLAALVDDLRGALG